MSKHLKTRVIFSLKGLVSCYKPSPARSVIPARGVRYFVPVECYEAFWGAMNSVEEGRRYRKHIVVRHSPEHNGLLQLYTYHFPKTWSQACQDNRSLIKLAQRQAHALEHDYSMTGLEYRLRFFKHYFNVFRLHQDPEPGFKRYARFYQYTFVAIYRELKAAYQAAKDPAERQPLNPDEITIDPIKSVRSLQAWRSQLTFGFEREEPRGAMLRPQTSIRRSFLLARPNLSPSSMLLSPATLPRAHDINKMSQDQAAFKAQSTYTTMRSYLWALEAEAYDAQQG